MAKGEDGHRLGRVASVVSGSRTFVREDRRTRTVPALRYRGLRAGGSYIHTVIVDEMVDAPPVCRSTHGRVSAEIWSRCQMA